MSKKTCGDCIHYDSALSYCRQAKAYLYAMFGQKECPFTDEPPTVFRQITTSPEVLAESVTYTYEMAVGGSMYRVYWTSPFVDNFYTSKAEAISATVERLNSMINDIEENL